MNAANQAHRLVVARLDERAQEFVGRHSSARAIVTLVNSGWRSSIAIHDAMSGRKLTQETEELVGNPERVRFDETHESPNGLDQLAVGGHGVAGGDVMAAGLLSLRGKVG